MIRTSLIVIVSTFLIAYFVFQDRTERRVALLLSVTGNGYHHSDEYFNTSTPDLAITLSKLGFEVIESIEPDRKTMLSRMHEFADTLKNADVALIYFSGEVAQFSGRNYLIPTDMKANRPWLFETYGIPLDPLLHEMGRKVQNSFVFLNACQLTWKHFDRRCYGLVPVGAAENILIAHANQADRIKYPHRGNEAAFVEALVFNLNKTGLPVQQFLQNVHTDVKRHTRAYQRPWVENAKGKSFVFNNTKAIPFQQWNTTPPKVASIIPLTFNTLKKVENVKNIDASKQADFNKDASAIKIKRELKEVRMDKNTAIRVMQKRLASFGCYRGKVDGIWGRKSRRAARLFKAHTGADISPRPDAIMYKAISGYMGPVCKKICKSKANVKCTKLKRIELAYIPVIVQPEESEKYLNKRVKVKKRVRSKRKSYNRLAKRWRGKRRYRKSARRIVQKSRRSSVSKRRVKKAKVLANLFE